MFLIKKENIAPRCSIIPDQNVIICQADYPINKNWRQIYARNYKVQDLFFEALYDLP